MNTTEHDIPPDVRAAIGAFLNEIQNEARPFAISEALGAIRRIFPSLEISDADLADAISSEASMAGLDIDFDIPTSSQGIKRKALERWDDEGGATGEPLPVETRRGKENDMRGTQRQGKASNDKDDDQGLS